MATLTHRQQQILDFITSYREEKGFSPTISEIQKEFSFKSPNAVQAHIKALTRKGRIRRSPHAWRGLEVVGTNNYRNGAAEAFTVSVPLIGRVAAGSPVLAEENIEGMISVDRSLVRRTTGLFALHVKGDSMIKVGIFHGDTVIAQQQSVADNGDIVIALLGDEATVKRFYRKGDVVILHPENDAMQPIEVSEGEDFMILGEVVATLRRIINV